jgi:hypothetical protein
MWGTDGYQLGILKPTFMHNRRFIAKILLTESRTRNFSKNLPGGY